MVAQRNHQYKCGHIPNLKRKSERGRGGGGKRGKEEVGRGRRGERGHLDAVICGGGEQVLVVSADGFN